MKEGLLVDRAAEHGDDLVSENQIDSGEDQAGRHAEKDRIADTSARLLSLLPSKTDRDERAAAVSHHDRNGERHDREREHDRIGRVAVGAQIAGVRDEDLVDDVIKRAHKKRDDARQRVAAHKLSDRRGPEKCVVLFHIVPPKNAQKITRALCNRNYAKCHTLSYLFYREEAPFAKEVLNKNKPQFLAFLRITARSAGRQDRHTGCPRWTGSPPQTCAAEAFLPPRRWR